MGAVDDRWNWLYPAIQDLKRTPDQPWEARRKTFLEQLGVSDPDSDPVVGDLLRRLDELPESDRGPILESDQLDTMAYESVRTHVTEPETGGYDEAAWQEYLTTNGATWDGTAESWDGFHQWFTYYAAERGLSAPATAFLDSLTGLSVADRIAAFGQHGVTIAAAGGRFGWVTAPQADALSGVWGPDWQEPLATDLAGRWGADWEANPADHKTAWLADLIASGAFAGAAAGPADQEALLARFAAQVKDIPGIDQLSDEEITRIITETINQAGR